MVSPSMLRPVIDDQYTAARAYFLCITTLPSAIPFITRNNIPILVRVSVFTFLNFLWGWNKFAYTTNYQLYGWLTISNGGLSLLVSARTNLFSHVARIPSAVLLSLIIQHYVQTNQFYTAAQAPRIPVGIAAWVALCIIAITSVPKIFRRRWFEAFYYPHFFFLVFVAGALYHANKGPEFLLPGFCLWLVDRSIRFYNNFRSLKVKSVIHYSGGVTKFNITGVAPSQPGQIAWVQIPSVSFFNWHPFTIASAPGQNEATIAIRALGSFTKMAQNFGEDAEKIAQPVANEREIYQTASTEMHYAKVQLDGPYGVGHLHWGAHPVVVLVAGGIGITPGISIATHIVNQAVSGLVPMPGSWHIHLLWTVKNFDHISWFEAELKNLASIASDQAVPVTLDITIHVTSGEEEESEFIKFDGIGNIFQGRPDITQWFEAVKEARVGMDASVNLCGPAQLVRSGRIAASKASCEDILFHVEEETFEF
ncbi:ferredoxin reductase-like, c-terminal nadp-linked [Trichoderma arundinaceum]|uniref:Ferredoxin reductase-like, c-terminal nadp-linked n=1 Tax=Trichoderma arundinaceum TaxID=490622 RepID=A0A395NX23_TRIAR|nr:ferredoxin reductase-like, c-terminal nadp-linked [Trichoderma arundinaceum]